MRPQEPPGRAIAEDTGIPDTEYRAREACTLRLDASS